MYPSIDLDAQTESNHDTALTLACAGGHAELVSLLLSRGADIEHRDKKGQFSVTQSLIWVVTAMTWGKNLPPKMKIKLCSRATKFSSWLVFSPIFCCIRVHRINQFLAVFLAKLRYVKFGTERLPSFGNSEIWTSSLQNIYPRKIDKCKRIYVVFLAGFTPLILAATAGHSDVVEILLDHGADIEAQSERTKDTPLSLACSGGRYEVSARN